MRVHGDKVIKRRPQIKRKSNYHDYLPDLQEDFYHMCGYCGKTEDVTRNAFEIDHFVPQKYDESRKNDYNNLVYSCYVCNRKKASIWPSKNAGVQFSGNQGFIDPATEDYDKHLERDEKGAIHGKTEIGRYMEKVFAFDLRPMHEVWQMMQLYEKKRQLREKIENSGQDLKDIYIKADLLMEELGKILFENKE